MSEARYAIYFTPAQGSGLEQVGSAVLGRSARTDRVLAQPALPGINPARLLELTASPRHYGFHGTLKPPFFLSNGTTEKELLDAVSALATGQNAFDLPPLKLKTIGSFLALTPSAPCSELDDLARTCVVELDRFRSPPDPQELARRRAEGLTPNQERLLAQWGYPYVLEEFRFHLTLTGRIPDADERLRVHAGLTTLLGPVTSQAVPVREIVVFRQPGPDSAFMIMNSHALLPGA